MLKYYFTIFCIFTHYIFTQTIFNSSLKINHGDGSTFASYTNDEKNYYYSQAIFDMNFYSGFWNFHAQLEFSSPPEIGISKKGLRRFSLRYNKDNYNLIIGDIYKSWGKGLTLSQYDDVSIGYDNGIRGASFGYNENDLDIEFVSGVKDLHIYTNSSSLVRRPDKKTLNNVIGINFNKKFDKLNIGLSSLLNKEKFAVNSFSSDSSVSSHIISSFYGNYFGKDFDFSFEYAKKNTTIDPSLMVVKLDLSNFTSDTTFRKISNGTAFAFSSNYLLSIFSFSLDYAYYAFYVGNPLERSYNPLPEGVSGFQKPMLANQEHSSILLNRLTHLQDSNDEIGLNISFSMDAGLNGNLILNSSLSSRTKEWYRRVGDSQVIAGPWKVQKKGYIFPSTNVASNPYRQNTLSYEKFFAKGNYQVLVSKINEVKILYENDISDTETKQRYDLFDAFTVPVFFEYNLFRDYSLTLNMGYQTLKKGIKVHYKNAPDIYTSYFESVNGESADKQETYAFSFGISKSSKWSFVFNLERDKYNEAGANSNNVKVNLIEKIIDPMFDSLDRTWISTQLTYRFDDDLRVSFFYGSNKGGISCTNGICRYFPGFSDGFRLELTKTIY